MKIKGIKLLKGDVLIASFIIIVAVLIFVLMLPKNTNAKVLNIYIDGALKESLELTDTLNQKIEIDSTFHNAIEIIDGKVHVIDSTCYDHVCENYGFIEKTGQYIVCMPNKLLIKIEGEKDSDLDGVVG